MPVKIFTLQHVPEDEAEEIRELLTSNQIEYYETSAGNWGISAPAIWVNDDGQAPHARQLIDQYQHARAERAREEYALLKQAGRHRTLLDLIKENPRQFFVYLVALVAIVYLSTMPFINLR